MRNAIILILAAMPLLSCGSLPAKKDEVFRVQDFEHDRSDFNYVPAAGYVDKPEVAVGIAEAVTFGVYGRDQIESQRPYLVKRLGDRWIVRGSFPPDKAKLGGNFEIEVSSADGKILRVMHGK